MAVGIMRGRSRIDNHEMKAGAKGNEDVLTELSCRWLQDKGSGKGSEEDVLKELSHQWLQDKGSGKGSQKDALTKLWQWWKDAPTKLSHY